MVCLTNLCKCAKIDTLSKGECVRWVVIGMCLSSFSELVSTIGTSCFSSPPFSCTSGVIASFLFFCCPYGFPFQYFCLFSCFLMLLWISSPSTSRNMRFFHGWCSNHNSSSKWPVDEAMGLPCTSKGNFFLTVSQVVHGGMDDTWQLIDWKISWTGCD